MFQKAGISKRHFLIIDEAADIAKDAICMDTLTEIVRKGRGAGYYVIYATQYPSSEAIPMQIKRNIPARLCFVLDSSTASTTVLDSAGAEKLPEIPGRGIYKNVKQTIIQCPIIKNSAINDLIKPFIITKRRKSQMKPLTKRQEEILLSLKKLDFLNRDQLSTIHRLGKVRNTNGILRDLSPYLSNFREEY